MNTGVYAETLGVAASRGDDANRPEAESQDLVFVAGVGRSGTTWLSEIINHEGKNAVVFEPFFPKRVPAAEGFTTGLYLRAGCYYPQLQAAASRILRGEIRNDWTDRYGAKPGGHPLLMKEIRANLYLKWLHGLAPGMKIVLILRHPCAVANSQAITGFPGMNCPNLNHLLSNEDLVSDHLKDFIEFARKVRDPFDIKILSWCINNLVPLALFGKSDMLVVFYEDLVRSPTTEITRIFDYLSRSVDVDGRDWWTAPSRVAVQSTPRVSGCSPTYAWVSQISKGKQADAMAIVREMGLSRLYGSEADPQIDAQNVLGSN